MNLLSYWFFLWSELSNCVLFTYKAFLKSWFFHSTNQFYKRWEEHSGKDGKSTVDIKSFNSSPTAPWCLFLAETRRDVALAPQKAMAGVAGTEPQCLWKVQWEKFPVSLFLIKLLNFRLTVHTTSWSFFQVFDIRKPTARIRTILAFLYT